jgi:hypothetical protein
MIKRIIAFIIRYIRRQEAERKRQEQELLLRKRKEEDARFDALEKFKRERAWTESHRREKLQSVKQMEATGQRVK